MLTDADILSTQRVRDVSPMFTLTRAEFCPASTMMPKGPKPKSTLVEYPFKKPFTPTNNAVLDGVDVTSADLTNNEANKFMLANRCQKGRIAIGVSDLAMEFGEEYAAVDLMADNMKDALQQARESLEIQTIDSQDSRAQGAGGPTNPALMRGYASAIRSSNPANPDLPIPTDCLTPSASIRSGISDVTTLKDTDFNTIMQSIATAARMKGTWDVFVSPDLMAAIDGWTRLGEITSTTVPLRRFEAGQNAGEVVMEVRFYQTTFGRMRFHVHYTLPTGVHALIMNMEGKNKLRPGYPVRTKELPYLGGGYRRILEWVFTEEYNPISGGKITT
jgi:hypothetical protein